MLDLSSFHDFSTAAKAAMSFLRQRMGFNLWMVTRTEGDNWVVLHAEDHGYGVTDGQVFRWADSFCSHMVLGNGPRISPCSDDVPAYAAAPIGRQVVIGSYVGVPLTRSDGTLFGTLCAIHPQQKPREIVSELPLVELIARLLSSLLETDLRAAESARRAERLHAEAQTDTLTSLYNRRGWDQLLEAEERRCSRFGHPACIISIDLDGLKTINDTLGHAQGDEMIRKAGQAIRSAIREQDIVARLGGDEFIVLGVECDADGGVILNQRIHEALAKAGIEGSIGVAQRDPRSGFTDACERADQEMYVRKRKRKQNVVNLNSPSRPTNETDCKPAEMARH